MRIAVLSAVLVFAAATAAHATNPKDAIKICTDRYNVEHDGGTIPKGMPKSKYMSQCTGSIRRQAELDQQFAQGPQGTAQTDEDKSGSNEATATPTKPATVSKPPRVKTTLTLGTSGH